MDIGIKKQNRNNHRNITASHLYGLISLYVGTYSHERIFEEMIKGTRILDRDGTGFLNYFRKHTRQYSTGKQLIHLSRDLKPIVCLPLQHGCDSDKPGNYMEAGDSPTGPTEPCGKGVAYYPSCYLEPPGSQH
ncbi:hypothetical protein SAMN06265218_10833 [Fodinibius sediminis]|uniref:Uncharacterized protein n=1 Tax=Fodinibius sediminis TaxID=1214077 RepID=A0A521CYX1_9BACT|nr:hypothetical protein SAMN06265218_10833 [Fodinibius sediminis]